MSGWPVIRHRGEARLGLARPAPVGDQGAPFVRAEAGSGHRTSAVDVTRPVIGRKNWLFAGNEGGAQAAATLLSLVGSCRPHGIDPWEYLHTVLGVINDQPVSKVGELAPIHAAPGWRTDG
jgi:hypothetical protein